MTVRDFYGVVAKRQVRSVDDCSITTLKRVRLTSSRRLFNLLYAYVFFPLPLANRVQVCSVPGGPQILRSKCVDVRNGHAKRASLKTDKAVGKRTLSHL